MGQSVRTVKVALARSPEVSPRAPTVWSPGRAQAGTLMDAENAPVGSVVACGLIANARGCRLDEGSVHRCVINGKDYEQLLAKICQPLQDPTKKASQRTR